MTLSIEGLVEDLETRLGRLAADPVTLVCLLLAANALVEPYRGLDHDSRLYAVQILERIHPGSFAGDLYLRYGSQDRYSVFTVLMAPLVQLCGLHVTFFCVYLASKALLFWSLLRLTRVLISSNLALILALIHLAIVPVAFGGNEIFHVNESFLTPRLSSCALVLLALERMLAGRIVVVGLLLLGSLVLHPLMAVGGILPAGLWWMARRCTWRQFVWLALAAVALATLVIGVEPLGNRLFGHMDDVWRTINLKICFYIRPARWWWSDWIRIALGCGFVVWTAAQCPRSSAGDILGSRSGVRPHRPDRLPDRRELPLPPADPGLTLPDALASGVAGDSRRLRAGRSSLAVRQPAVSQCKLGRRAAAHLELGRRSLGHRPA